MQSGALPTVLQTGAILPTRGSSNAAGLDLYANEDVTLTTSQTLVHTGVSMSIPTGYFGNIRSRSGLAYKYGVCTEAGIIDSDYSGQIGVVMYCLNGTYQIKKGERIAQMIIQPYLNSMPYQVNELTATERGSNGFGSTGN